MNKVLFVCQANVGRSQMAEAFFNFHSGSKGAVSAGVEDFREKYHHRPTAEIIETMQEKGIDISHQRIDFLTPEMCAEAELIVVLCAKNLCRAFLLQNECVIFRGIEDPHEQHSERIRQIRDQVEVVVLEMLGLQSLGIILEDNAECNAREQNHEIAESNLSKVLSRGHTRHGEEYRQV